MQNRGGDGNTWDCSRFIGQSKSVVVAHYFYAKDDFLRQNINDIVTRYSYLDSEMTHFETALNERRELYLDCNVIIHDFIQ